MKILRQTLWMLVYALPAVLFFSYHPVISLGSSDSMNYELSLPLIWLVIFDLLAFIYALLLHHSHRKPRKTDKITNWGYNFPGISDRRFFLFSLFPLYATISIFWSANPTRGLLTAGVMWLVFCAVFAILYILPQGGEPRRLRTHVLLVFFVATFFVCKYCYAQSIMDILGLSRETTLLCLGCTYRSFGFPHPSGFAIEPQFMGNLLLAPTLTALYMVVFQSRQFAKTLIDDATNLETTVEQKLLFGKIRLPRLNWQKWQRIGMVLLSIDFATALFFTFSRGAIYAFGIAIIVMLCFAIKHKIFRWSLLVIPTVSFVLSLTLQGTLAAIGPTAETFTSAITKSIHQLSLGIIDLRVAVRDSLQETESELTGKDSDQPVENSHEFVDNSAEDVDNFTKTVENSESSVQKSTPSSGNNVQNFTNSVNNLAQKCAKDVQNSIADCVQSVQKPSESVDKPSKPVEDLAEIVDKAVEKHEENSLIEAEKTTEDVIFEGYVAESTNIRLNLNKTAVRTWLKAPGHSLLIVASNCSQPYAESCTAITPTSMLFGVGLGGAGNAMYQAFPVEIGSPKEIVQNEPFSLLLETGLIGIGLIIFTLLLAFWPSLFTSKFLDGRDATAQSSQNLFWQHPAVPLLASLIVAYLITLNFFSGLPNALQIYLMPPLLYLIFLNQRSSKDL